ncbi:MAG: hypothetical protein ACTSP0_03880, partial [Alphaproteobacteria bacterium]
MVGTASSKDQLFIKSIFKTFSGSGSGKRKTAFTQALLHGLNEGDFEGFSPGAAGGIVNSAWEFALKRKPGKHKLRVYNPDDDRGPPGDITIIEVLNEDMPFLVDSVLGEIQERGLRVLLVLHPVLHVTRDSKQNIKTLTGVSAKAAESAIRESFIHVHVTRIAVDSERADLKKELAG